MLKKLVAIATTTLIPLAITTNALAVSLTESADVGDAIFNPGRTDTEPTGTTLDSINGSLNPAGDIDLYEILVSGGTFSASTVGNSNILDTQLFLFDANGIGVFASNDAPSDPFFKSSISLNLAAGTYYIGISSYGSDALSSGGLIFDLAAADPTSPNGPGAAFSLSGWSNNPIPEGGNYSIAFSGAQFVGPATAAVPFEFNPLPGVLIFGIWGIWELKKRKL